MPLGLEDDAPFEIVVIFRFHVNFPESMQNDMFEREHIFQSIDDTRESTATYPCNFGGARYHKPSQANHLTIIVIAHR